MTPLCNAFIQDDAGEAGFGVCSRATAPVPCGPQPPVKPLLHALQQPHIHASRVLVLLVLLCACADMATMEWLFCVSKILDFMDTCAFRNPSTLLPMEQPLGTV